MVAGPATAPVLRVALLGSEPAEIPGPTVFASHIATELATRTRRRVEVRTVQGAEFDLAALLDTVRRDRLKGHDALVVAAAYRPQLAEIPLQQWRSYAESLRALLVEAAGPEAVVRVLSLPWRDAARRAPMHWGGLFGNRVRVVAEMAEATLAPGQPAQPVRLQPPARATEWIGPSFSAQTTLRWADQVVAELCAALRL